MYAIIKTGGKQYKAAPGSVLKVEKIDGNVGDVVELSDVLLFSDGDNAEVDAKKLAGVVVKAEVIDQKKDKKIIVFKKKRRQNYRRKNGHRQQVTILRVKEVLSGGAKSAKASTEKKKTTTAKKTASSGKVSK